jgi:hypothetical protein
MAYKLTITYPGRHAKLTKLSMLGYEDSHVNHENKCSTISLLYLCYSPVTYGVIFRGNATHSKSVFNNQNISSE